MATSLKLVISRKGLDLRKVVPDTEGFVQEAQRENATDLQATAVRRAAKRSGYLATHIDVKRLGPLRYDLEATAPYAKFQEYGTAHMAAQPFLRPAAAEVQPRAEVRLKKALNKGIGRAGA